MSYVFCTSCVTVTVLLVNSRKTNMIVVTRRDPFPSLPCADLGDSDHHSPSAERSGQKLPHTRTLMWILPRPCGTGARYWPYLYTLSKRCHHSRDYGQTIILPLKICHYNRVNVADSRVFWKGLIGSDIKKNSYCFEVTTCSSVRKISYVCFLSCLDNVLQLATMRLQKELSDYVWRAICTHSFSVQWHK